MSDITASGFAFKCDENNIPLWVLFVAVQFVDIERAAFILLCIEKVRIVPGITATSALDLYSMPFTHSLPGGVGWSAFAVVPCRIISASRAPRKSALIVGLAVLSHWILDFIVHRPDLPLYDDAFKVGLGPWNFRYLAFALDATMLIGGMFLNLKRNSGVSRARKYAKFIFGTVMIRVQDIVTFAGRPLASEHAVAATNSTLYAVFACVAFLTERKQVKST